MVFFFPITLDGAIVILVARQPLRWWLFLLLAIAGSTAGAAVTFAIGRMIGEAGLERYAPRRRLRRLKARVRTTGAVTLALTALVPPPFPLTPFVLTCGALDVSRTGFFVTFAAARFVRFGLEAILARVYGPRCSGGSNRRHSRPPSRRSWGRRLSGLPRPDTGSTGRREPVNPGSQLSVAVQRALPPAPYPLPPVPFSS